MSPTLRLIAVFVLVAIPHVTTAGPSIPIKGSNTFGEKLGPLLLERYKGVDPAATFTLESRGSSSGIAALLSGQCNIAAASRTITEDERRLARAQGIKLNTYVIGYYGVAVVVNATNPVHNLSAAHVRDIFSGKISNWKTVGGPSASVRVLTHAKGSGSYFGFRELAMEGLRYAASAESCSTEAEVVSRVSGDQNAIAYAGFAWLDELGIRPVSVDHARPTTWEVIQNTYPYTRGLRFYTVAGQEPEAASRFIAFVRSKAGQTILASAGFVGFAEPLRLLPTTP